MKILRPILAILALLVVLAVIGWASYFFTHRGSSSGYTSENTPFDSLAQTNTYFVEAQAAANAGNYEQAKMLYTQALAQASDSAQSGQIAYKEALLEDQEGHQVEAIDLYKQIVANPSYDSYKLLKAYAVQGMAEVYYENGDPAVTAEIFKDAPYSGLVVQGNDALTYRNLDEYAASFYPLGLAELRIAGWYALHVGDASTPDGSATSTYPAIIQNAISLADADVQRTKTDTNAAALIPYILLRKEVVYISMYKYQLATAQQTEQVSQDAVNIFVSAGLHYQDGFARFYYAFFLSQLGASRLSDLQAVLAPLDTDPGYKGSYALSFFASEKANRFGQKSQLVTLAKDDPKFKTLLLSLGWSQTDF